MNTIADHLQNIHTQIQLACQKAGRATESVKLLAVSKQQTNESIRAAFLAGQHAFGENYVQEALVKIAQLSDLKLIWHFIGRIQANKTRAIAENFTWVHTLDRASIAQRLNDQRPAHLPPLQVCIQVNLAQETQKAGIHQEEIMTLARLINTLPHLKLRGLMTLPPADLYDYAEQYAYFKRIQESFLDLQKQGFAVDTLSMGMSHDFKAAIAAGATIIRIGTGIFGAR